MQDLNTEAAKLTRFFADAVKDRQLGRLVVAATLYLVSAKGPSVEATVTFYTVTKIYYRRPTELICNIR